MRRCHVRVAAAVLGAAVLATATDADTGGPPPAAEQTPPQGQNGTSRRKRVRSACAAELGLVATKETFKKYAQHMQAFCNASSPWAEQHLLVREVIGFVAPWNDHGYPAAKYFRGKLTAVSPLWFRVLPPQDASADAFDVVGHDFAYQKAPWVEDVAADFCLSQRCKHGPRILPHFSIEGFAQLGDLRAILEAPDRLAKKVASICKPENFAGAVFDIRLALFPSLKKHLPGLAAALGRELRAAGKQLVLSVPAAAPGAKRGSPDFDADDAAAVAGSVDAIVVGTRDFSRDGPGPAAPLPWVRACLERLLGKRTTDSGGATGARAEQLLLEIPLYGRAFKEGEAGGQVILAGETVKALARQKPKIVWDADAAEHSANLTKSRVHLSLPTFAFVEARLRLARELGVGVALRDVGTGLDGAFDLLPARTAAPSSGTATEGAAVAAPAAQEPAARARERRQGEDL